MTENVVSQERTHVDALIVGAGTAGLLAAHELLRRRPHTSLLLVEAGPSLAARLEQPPGGMSGLGGAGLYLGGRLYLGPATLPVLPPVSAPSTLRPILAGDAYQDRARAVDAHFIRLGARSAVRHAPDPRLAEAAARAAALGIEYILSYPTRPLTPEERRSVLARLHAELEQQGAHFAFGWRVVSAARGAAGFTVNLAAEDASGDARRIRTRALVLAPGRYGAEWLVRMAEALGAEVAQLPATFGVRLELPAAAYAPLTDLNPDPRLQMPLTDDAVIKTYATCPGGYVLPITRAGALVASGMPVTLEARRPSTTVAILAQPGVRGAEARWRGGEDLARRLNERVPGRLVVQRREDLRAGQATTAEALAAHSVRPTCAEAVPGALHDIYPAPYWAAFEALLTRIERLAPGVATGDALLYGPAEERFWHFPTSDQLETRIAGLFVAGDAAGQSQGTIQAGVAGTLAGEGVARHLG
ncbi:MAG: FAD-binding protein [Ktedonobacterales bacterium]|nr:FAD-binding protein [Ktedonobacterales bacterium]